MILPCTWWNRTATWEGGLQQEEMDHYEFSLPVLLSFVSQLLAPAEDFFFFAYSADYLDFLVLSIREPIPPPHKKDKIKIKTNTLNQKVGNQRFLSEHSVFRRNHLLVEV